MSDTLEVEYTLVRIIASLDEDGDVHIKLFDRGVPDPAAELWIEAAKLYEWLKRVGVRGTSEGTATPDA